MNTRYIVLGLLGVSNAASPSPIPNTDYPKFQSPVAPPNSDLGTNGDVKVAYSQNSSVNIGPIRGFRNGLTVFPTQTLVKADQSSSSGVCTVATASPNTSRAFWQVTAATQLGSYPASLDSTSATTAGNTAANGAIYLVCKSDVLADALKCNGGAFYANGNTNKSGNIANRIVQQANKDGTISVGGANSANFAWNEDIVLASFYHEASTDDKVDKTGAKWCSKWHIDLNKDGSKSTLTASKGWNGRTKCTWLVASPEAGMGPTIKLSTAASLGFFFNWIEWSDKTGLGSDATLPAADGASYYIGAYAVSGNEVYLNPMTGAFTGDATWKKSTIAWYYDQRDPSKKMPGSIGDIIFYPGLEGDKQQPQTWLLDQAILGQFYGLKETENSTYKNNKATYDPLKDAYNTAVANEKKRLGDVFASAIQSPVSIPAKPCPPNPPPTAWSGVALDMNRAVTGSSKTWPTTYNDAKTLGYLASTTSGSENQPNDLMFTRSGFIQSSPDTSASTPKMDYAGHVFGKLGQGQATMPANANPFYWGDTTSKKSAMLVSAFPSTDAETGITDATKVIEIDATLKKYESYDSFTAPTAQAASSEAVANNAKALTLGLASSILVIASLV